MILKRLRKQLICDESEKLHLYKCPAGYLTIGIGRNIEQRGISKDESELMFKNDVDLVLKELAPSLLHHHSIKLDSISSVRQEVLLNMAFQLGVPRLMKFKNTFAYIKNADYENASIEMLDSLWFKQMHEMDMVDGKDSLNRAERLSYAMKNDKFIKERVL